MQIYAEGKLLAVSKEGFTDNEGVKVEYCTNVVKTSDGIMTFNSKRDFSEYEGKEGIITLRLSEDAEKKNRFKVSVVEIRVNETLGMPEAVVH